MDILTFEQFAARQDFTAQRFVVVSPAYMDGWSIVALRDPVKLCQLDHLHQVVGDVRIDALGARVPAQGEDGSQLGQLLHLTHPHGIEQGIFPDIGIEEGLRFGQDFHHLVSETDVLVAALDRLALLRGLLVHGHQVSFLTGQGFDLGKHSGQSAPATKRFELNIQVVQVGGEVGGSIAQQVAFLAAGDLFEVIEGRLPNVLYPGLLGRRVGLWFNPDNEARAKTVGQELRLGHDVGQFSGADGMDVQVRFEHVTENVTDHLPTRRVKRWIQDATLVALRIGGEQGVVQGGQVGANVPGVGVDQVLALVGELEHVVPGTLVCCRPEPADGKAHVANHARPIWGEAHDALDPVEACGLAATRRGNPKDVEVQPGRIVALALMYPDPAAQDH